jgi:hypothetical protein
MLLFFGGIGADAQGVLIYEQDTTAEGCSDRYNKIDMEFQVGSWIPIGMLENTFDNGVSLGFRMGVPLKAALRADAGVVYNAPSQARDLTYVLPDTSYRISGVRAHIVEINSRLAYRLAYNSNWDVETFGGIGFVILSSNQPVIENPDAGNFWYRIGTLQLNAGISVYRRVFGAHTMGFFADYSYAPFALSGRLPKGFGNSYLRAGLTVRVIKSGQPSYGPDSNGWFVLESEG